MNELNTHEILLCKMQAVSRQGEVDEEDIQKELLACKAKGIYPGRVFSFYKAHTWKKAPVDGGRIKETTIILNPFEKLFCLKLGPERTKASRSANKKNMIRSGEGGSATETFIEQNGICGELSYAIMRNLYPAEQLEIKARSSSEDLGDFVDSGYVVDVKTTEYPGGRLTLGKWKPGSKKEADFLSRIQLMALFTGDCRAEPSRCEESGVYVFRGYFSAKEMINRKPRCLPGRQESQYLAEQDELFPKLEDAVVK